MVKSNKLEVVLINKSDEVLGYRERFAAHRNPVPLHRAVSVVIFSPDKKKMLIQKRSKNKKTWPMYWSNAVCTNNLPRESYQKAATRRLKEELGITMPLKKAFSFIYKARYDKTWGEHELDTVFVGTYKGKLNPDPDEIADLKWIGLEELKNDVRKNSQNYTPWFKMILGRMLKES